MRFLVCVILVGCETVQVRPAVEAAPEPGETVEAQAAEEAGSPLAVSLSVGPRSSCAALADGSLWCWGDGDDGLLGGDAGPGPVRVLEAEGLSRVVVGQRRVCFVADEGVRCFGHFGSYRNPARAVRTTPFAVPGLGEVSDLSVGIQHVCFAEAGGSVRCMGLGARAGGGTRTRHLGDVVVTNADSVAVGDSHSCALVREQVHCWGDAWGGRFGGANVRSFSDTAHRVPELEGVRNISAYSTGGQTCALLAEDDIRCWGMTGHPVFGAPNASLGDSVARLEPVGEPVAHIVTGLVEVFAVAESGAVYRYLSQEPVAVEGVVGDQTSYGDGVRLELPPVSDIGVGLTHTCALTRDGAVLCWGLGAGGRLGNGTHDRSTPTRVHFREASEE